MSWTDDLKSVNSYNAEERARLGGREKLPSSAEYRKLDEDNILRCNPTTYFLKTSTLVLY